MVCRLDLRMAPLIDWSNCRGIDSTQRRLKIGPVVDANPQLGGCVKVCGRGLDVNFRSALNLTVSA